MRPTRINREDHSTSTLDGVLNRVWALKHSRICTLREIAKAIGSREQRVSEWINQRSKRPNGENAMKLQSFAAKKLLEVALMPVATRNRFNKSFHETRTKFQ